MSWSYRNLPRNPREWVWLLVGITVGIDLFLFIFGIAWRLRH